MKKIQSQSTSNPNSIAQYAAVAALDGDQSCVSQMVEQFKKRHDHMLAKLQQMAGVKCIPSDGTFYLFPDLHAVIERMPGIETDVQLAEHLLNTVGLALVPGSAFGTPGCVRLSCAAGIEVLDSALERLAKGIQ